MNKILLDRSIFCQNKIALLKSSKLKELTQRNTIKIYGNPILFEETLNLWFKDRKKELKEHLEYILDITNGRWFRNREEIWEIELEDKNPSNKYFFLTSAEQQNIINQICEQIFKERLDRATEEAAKKVKTGILLKNKNIKTTCLKMRKDVSEKLKQRGKKRSDIKESFEDFYNKNVDLSGEEIIKKHLKTKCDKNVLINNWKLNKEHYPYFTLWIKAFLYIPFYAMSNPNYKIDLNAIADIDQLVHLKDLDIMVSDEAKFMKAAFLQLYSNNKHFLSLIDFLKFINNY